MLKIIAIIFLAIIALPVFHTTSYADNIVISGRITFTCDLIASYMEEKFGHKYVKEVPNGKYKTNLFTVNTDVVIRNGKNEIVGLVKTDKDGIFKALVEQSNYYTVNFTFLNKEHTKILSKDSLSFLDFDFGHLSSTVFGR